MFDFQYSRAVRKLRVYAILPVLAHNVSNTASCGWYFSIIPLSDIAP